MIMSSSVRGDHDRDDRGHEEGLQSQLAWLILAWSSAAMSGDKKL